MLLKERLEKFELQEMGKQRRRKENAIAELGRLTESFTEGTFSM